MTFPSFPERSLKNSISFFSCAKKEASAIIGARIRPAKRPNPINPGSSIFLNPSVMDLCIAFIPSAISSNKAVLLFSFLCC